ncbi:Mitochondrial fission protein [Linderina macrospora]|uniref:Mitochondrial fission protein n=1 Tax=Linderina macrospora TaxID=4868 RepID=A0ACC1JC39_9FUNG|nr:Mitochondrial fission protein [Linderina macrospora]
MDVLRGRRGEYTEHLRRLEGVRKQLVQKMRDLDDQIMASSASRKAIDERIAALEQTLSSRNPHPTEDEISAHKEASKTEAHKPTTVEDVNEDSSDDMEYEQDDVPRLRELRQAFSGHYGGITAMDYDADQGLVASGSLDTQVRVWDAATGACKYTISGHSDVIRGVQFYDRFLITGASDGRMRMWDLSLFDSVQPRPSTKIMREEYVAPTREGSSFAHSDDDDDNDDSGDEYDNMMFPRRPDTDDHGSDASNGGRRRMRRPRSPKTIMTLQSTTPPVSPTICHHVPPLELCCENTFVGHKDAVTCFQASYGTLISGGADKTIREWDLSTGQMRQTIDVAWATKDSHAARVASRGLQSASPWSSPRTRRGTDSGDGGFIGALQFYDFALATGTADGVLRLWDMRTAQAHRQMIGHSQPITSLQFDEQTILTGSLDGTAQLWDLRSGKILQTLKYGRPVTSVQVTGGGASFATQCWLAAGDSCLHHYSANSMQRASYASDFGACNSARSKWQMVGEDAGTADVTRVRAMGSDTLLSGDANGVVKLWRI